MQFSCRGELGQLCPGAGVCERVEGGPGSHRHRGPRQELQAQGNAFLHLEISGVILHLYIRVGQPYPLTQNLLDSAL